jgi:hypothetical protein
VWAWGGDASMPRLGSGWPAGAAALALLLLAAASLCAPAQAQAPWPNGPSLTANATVRLSSNDGAGGRAAIVDGNDTTMVGWGGVGGLWGLDEWCYEEGAKAVQYGAQPAVHGLLV